jgi:hypothetical protein
MAAFVWRGRAKMISRWICERRLVLATGLVAGLPIVVATVEALAEGWVPLADDALIAVKSLDVLTSHSPLLGPWSSGYSEVVGEPTFHPGPLLFWLLALPARLPWPGALVVTVGLVNLASAMGVVALAHRRGGRGLMFVTAGALLLMLSSLPAESYSDIWNPSAPLLPFTLLIFLAWSVACGEYRLLPLTVLAASFVPQCHLAFLVPALGLLVVAMVGLGLARRSASDGVSARPWIVASIVVAAVCWSAPAIDQATNSPGNLVLIGRGVTAHKATLGFRPGYRAVVHAVGVLPWWLREPEVGIERVVDLSIRPGWLTIVSAIAIVGALAALVVIGWRRRRHDVVAAAALSLVLCAAVGLVTSSTPASSFATLGYSLRWASPAGMWVWLALGWSLAALVRLPRAAALSRARAALATPSAAVAGVGLVSVVAVVVAVSGERTHNPYRQLHTIADRLDAELPPHRATRLDVAGTPDSTYMALGLESGALYFLRRDGRRVAVSIQKDYLGSHYAPGQNGAEQSVRFDLGTPSPRNARVIARVPVTQYPDPADPLAPRTPPRWTVVVSLVP